MKKIYALLIGLAFFAINALAAVNINTANQAQLETLNGIGPAKAKAIIDYRTKNGPFKTVDDLDKVPGIGQGILGKIKADIAISGETSVKAADKKPEDKKAASPEKKADDKKAAVKEEKKAEPAKPAAKEEDKGCEAKAAEKKLAGAAKDTFLKKCKEDSKKPAAKEEKKTDKK